MKTKDYLGLGLLCGFVLGNGIWIMVGISINESTTKTYQAEAFNRGYMEKKIDENDEVIYVWIEPKDK
jgi:hypothetical protein